MELNSGSVLDYGSEFRDPKILDKLLAHHPKWEKLQDILQV